MRVHFVAVAGTGMGALAGLFRAAGHDVSGSDVNFDPPMGPALERWGIRLMRGFDPSHLDPAPDLVVVGNVCRSSNVEAQAAMQRGIRFTDMAHALADQILDKTSPLVVAGTHGKTTTSALAAWLLYETNLNPGFLIGGLPKNFDHSFRLAGASPTRLSLLEGRDASPSPRRKTPFVIEGDEYDTAFFEKTPKFWHYRPEVAIVTSIEHDHIDIYRDEASYVDAFRRFVALVPASGLVIANCQDEKVVDVVRSSAQAEVAWYALEGDDTHGRPPHWLGAPAVHDATGQSFDLFVGGVAAGRVRLPMSGHHNVRNAIAALAAVSQGYGVALERAIAALTKFEGVRRRQDLLYEIGGVRVYDDFAHHPTAVAETLHGLRARHPEGELWAVFEPRSATACRSLHQSAYESAFRDATRVVLAPLGRSEIPEAERLDRRRIVAAIERSGGMAWAADSIDAIIELLTKEARAGDTIALLSNGAFGGIHGTLRRSLEAAHRTP